MKGIHMNKSMEYRYSSPRYFAPGEHHITRFCEEDVLLLVFEGILRFREADRDYEVGSGEYHIQRAGTYQSGPVSSSTPKYFYVHFVGTWTEDGPCLASSGTFNYAAVKPLTEELDCLRREDATLAEKTALFLTILSKLYQKEKIPTVADRMAKYLQEHYREKLTLQDLSRDFHFSPNHIINLFHKEYGMTPFAYLNVLKIKQAEWLLEVTSNTLESIAYECGFRNYSYFYRTFEKQNGISPKEWRLTRQNQPPQS